jgi:hypothetical protein
MGGSLKIRKKAKRKAAVSEDGHEKVHEKFHPQFGSPDIIVRPVEFRYGLFGTC